MQRRNSRCSVSSDLATPDMYAIAIKASYNNKAKSAIIYVLEFTIVYLCRNEHIDNYVELKHKVRQALRASIKVSAHCLYGVGIVVNCHRSWLHTGSDKLNTWHMLCWYNADTILMTLAIKVCSYILQFRVFLLLSCQIINAYLNLKKKHKQIKGHCQIMLSCHSYKIDLD